VVAIKVKSGNAIAVYALEQNGRRELWDFLFDLKASSCKDFARLVSLFDRTAEYGRIKNEQMFKYLANDIYEFKTFGGFRVLCFFDGGRMIVLTNGFKKRKDYSAEIQKAVNLRVNYLNAKSNGCLTYREDVL